MDHDFDTEEHGLYSERTAKHHGLTFYDDGYKMTIYTQSTVEFSLTEDGIFDFSEIPGEYFYWLPPWGIRNVQKSIVLEELLLSFRKKISDDDKMRLQKTLELNILHEEIPKLSHIKGSDLQSLKWKLYDHYKKDPTLMLLEISLEELENFVRT